MLNACEGVAIMHFKLLQNMMHLVLSYYNTATIVCLSDTSETS